jgi:surface antigen
MLRFMSLEGSRRINYLLVLLVWCLSLLAAINVTTGRAAAGTDDYPSAWQGRMDSMLDSWGYYNRECTSFVAWRLHARNGYEMPRAIGNGGTWGNWAMNHNIRVDKNPAVGSVAWSSTHVAWVEAVDLARAAVTIEDYNGVDSNHDGMYGNDGTYSERTVPADSYQYIHFKDISESASFNSTAKAYKGRMVRDPYGNISYVAANYFRYWVPNMNTVNCLGGMAAVSQVDFTTLGAIPGTSLPANCMTRYTGSMIRAPNGAISYVDTNQIQHWVPNMETVNCLGVNLYQLDWASYNAIASGYTGATCSSHYSGRLIRAPDGTIEYLDSDNVKHWVTSTNTASCYGGLSSFINMDWQPYGQYATGLGADCSDRYF